VSPSVLVVGAAVKAGSVVVLPDGSGLYFMTGDHRYSMSSFKGFRDFVELYIVPPTPETEKMLNEPSPEIGYPKKIRRKRFRSTLGGKVKRGVFHPTQSLGIDRIKMPQFKDKLDFLRWMMGLGVKVERIEMAPAKLLNRNDASPTAFAQNAIYVDKAIKKVRKKGALSSLIILSKDNTIVDGNHHWLALMQVAPYMPVPMFKVDLPFQDVYALSKHYPKVSYSP